MKSYKGRKLNEDKPVQIYRNLTKGCYSIKQGGKVVAHTDEVNLTEAEFWVNENGRQQVIKSNRKNVHATITGYIPTPLEEATANGSDRLQSVGYNPYKGAKFCVRIDGTHFPIRKTRFVALTQTGVFATV